MALLPNHSRCSRHSPRIKSGGGFNQPVGDQDLQNVVPARSLPARRQALGPEPIELQVSPQPPGQPTGPHCRGRCKRSSDRRSRTTEESSARASQRSSGNKASVWEPPASTSKTSTALHQVSACDELISPKYRTCRCTTRPPSRRLFSTTLQ